MQFEDEISLEDADRFVLENEQRADQHAVEAAESAGVTFAAGEMPDEISLEEADQLLESGVSFPDEISLEDADKALVAMNIASGRFSETLAAGQKDGYSTHNTWQAYREYAKRDNSILDQIANHLSFWSGQQWLTRKAIWILEAAGKMTPEDAKIILSHDEVVPSDIVNFYWGDSESGLGSAAKFTAGLLADVIFDPLTWTGIGAAAKTVTVAGKSFSGLSKLSRGERAYIRGAKAVEKILTKNGELIDAGQAANKNIRQNLVDLAEGKIGFDDFLKQAKPSTDPAVLQRAFSKAATGDSLFDIGKQLVKGERSMTIGLNIPGTRIAKEIEVPLLGAIPGAMAMAVAAPFELTKRFFYLNDATGRLWSQVTDIWSRTGKHIYDEQEMLKHGRMESLRQRLTAWEKSHRSALGNLRERIGDEEVYSKLIEDLVEEIEMRPLSMEEAKRIAKLKNRPISEVIDVTDDFGRPQRIEVISKDIEYVTRQTPEDIARAERLQKYPELIGVMEDIQRMNAELIKEYRARNIPFEELNPFGEGWARNYLKHLITNDWFEYSKRVAKGSDEIEEALDLLHRTIGGVEKTEAGRRFRKSIKTANAISQAEAGIKIFVDDPLELTSRRLLEMEQVIQNYDLLDAASNYAVKGRPPGRDWIKFDANEFTKMVMDDGAKFKPYVPDFYKTDEAIYLPYDVYDRLRFQINGFNPDNLGTKIMKVMEPFNNLFRNHALMGFSYNVTNILGNMGHYLMNNIGGVDSLVDAAKAMWFGGKTIIRDQHGRKFAVDSADLLKEAIEHNAYFGGFSSELKSMDEIADHIASNRQARQGLWPKIKNAADVAYLFRLNRHIAQTADSLPKLAVYINQRKLGMSPRAAAETADKYFYSFNIGSRGMEVVGRTIPFSKFPMKTLEYVMTSIREGNLGRLTVPGKVQNILEGEFVESPEIRSVLARMVPGYQRLRHPVWGPLMPGARAVAIEIPWATSTIANVFEYDSGSVPLFKLLASAATATRAYLGGKITGIEDEYADLAYERFHKEVKNALKMLIPPWLMAGLELYDIETGGLGGVFASQYEPTVPSYDDMQVRDSLLLTEALSPNRIKFENAVEFGRYVSESPVFNNWLYNLIFGREERFFEDGTKIETGEDQLRMAARGEWIRKRFRQLTGGTASLNKLDQNVLIHQLAMKRQINRLQSKILSDLNRAGHVIDATDGIDPKYAKALEEKYPEVKELLRLRAESDALIEYYDWILKLEAEEPEAGSLIFGVDTNTINDQGYPRYYDRLTLEAEDFSNEEAEEAIRVLQMGEKPESAADDDSTEFEIEEEEEEIPLEEFEIDPSMMDIDPGV